MKLFFLLVFLSFTSPLIAEQKTLPTPLELLTAQGAEIVSEFAAPANMTGYVADFKGQVITVYLTDDDQYLFTGSMLDAKGNNIGEQAVNDYATGPKAQKDWKVLEDSHWILDGSLSAKRIVYTFTDPNCPYCRKFWQNARPWVDAGDVQIRHILVGILKADSLGKAGAIMNANNPEDVLRKFENNSLARTLQPLKNMPEHINTQLMKNHQIMMSVGARATPATFYHDSKGAVKMQMGLPPESLMSEILGPLSGK
ncbi:MAG: thiol:disulfide interchange protein DsbG [Pseudoalteromonas sp.]